MSVSFEKIQERGLPHQTSEEQVTPSAELARTCGKIKGTEMVTSLESGVLTQMFGSSPEMRDCNFSRTIFERTYQNTPTENWGGLAHRVAHFVCSDDKRLEANLRTLIHARKFMPGGSS